MAKYDKTKKYWLQLKDDWFDDDAIKWLEEQNSGEKYAYFYMKLMAKSIKTKGVLIRQVGEMLVPYDAEALSKLTNIDVDTVIVAIQLLKQIGLIKILDDGAIYIQQVEKLTNCSTISAIKKQEQLERRKNE